MNAHGALAVLLVAACTAMPARAADGADTDERLADWIGRIDAPLPSGWRNLSGSCIASADDPCARAVSVVRDEQSGMHTLLATRTLQALDGSKPGGARPLALVTDALDVDGLGRAHHEMVAGLCELRGRADPRIVAVVDRSDDTEWYASFARLWRLDDAGRLAPLPHDGVRCRNEGFGFDG